MTRRTDAQDGGAGQAPSGVERELKFIADRKTLKAAVSAPFLGGEAGPPTWRELRSVYFDDDDGDLSRARVALRVRHVDGGWVIGTQTRRLGGPGRFRAGGDGGALAFRRA